MKGLKKVLVALVVLACFAGIRAAEEVELPPLYWLYPYPQEVEAISETLSLAGASIFMPEGADTAVEACARLLQQRLAHFRKAELPIETFNADLNYVLAIAKGADGLGERLRALNLSSIPQDVADEGYALKVDAGGAVLRASAARGLFWGVLTVGGLAREPFGKERVLPGGSITDWPDMPFRGHLLRHGGRAWESSETQDKTAILAAECRYKFFVVQFNGGTVTLESHPEINTNRGEKYTKKTYGKLIDLWRECGIKCAPMLQVSKGHPHDLLPISFIPDTEDYDTSVKEIADEYLEMFRPRYFHFGLDEDDPLATRKWGEAFRSLEEFKRVVVMMAEYARRRGVTPMMWPDMLEVTHPFGRYRHDFAPFGSWDKFMDTIPAEMFMTSWRYDLRMPGGEYPETTRFAGKGFQTTLSISWGGIPHAKYVAQRRPEYPNLLGILGTRWRGANEQRKKVEAESQTLWNLQGYATREKIKNLPEETRRAMNLWNGLDYRPMGMHALLKHEPRRPIKALEGSEALADPRWQVWLPAREELVAHGLDAVPVLLGPLWFKKGELRQRLEGCLSRIARAARGGSVRGRLKLRAVAPCLTHPAEDVRAIGAELIASALTLGDGRIIETQGFDPRAALYEALRKPLSFAACARALALIQDRECIPVLVQVLTDDKRKVEDRIVAAKCLEVLRAKEAAPQLLQVLKTASDVKLKRYALWTLAVLGEEQTVEEVCKYLDAGEHALRCRAGMALGLMTSPKAELLKRWLPLNDRPLMSIALWSIQRALPGEEAREILLAGRTKQKNPDLLKGYDYFLKRWGMLED